MENEYYPDEQSVSMKSYQTNALEEKIAKAFTERFGEKAAFFVRAPGRVNLIGEHTDYNDGFVLPVAINREIMIALRPRKDGRVVLFSMDFPEPAAFSLDGFDRGKGWQEYVKGIAWTLQQHDYRLGGWEGVLGSTLPVGAGLSSSAALEISLCRAFQCVSGWVWDGKRMALIAQEADHRWVGIQSGIMDQLISAEGKEGHALLIDCRSLSLDPIPLPGDTRIVILDTATRRGLVDSIYNRRVQECRQAAAFFGAQSLRDVGAEMVSSKPAGMPEDVYLRARHVITENVRTLQGAEALKHRDVRTFGELMNESHRSLRDDYQVSSKELDIMAEIAREQPGCYGARMTGAGFGGCVVALTARTNLDQFVDVVHREYEQRTGLTPHIYITGAAQGASMETV